MKIKSMACHTWALSGNPKTGALINTHYIELSDEIGRYYGYGENLRNKKLSDVQQETLERIAELCDIRTQALDHDVFLCAGFRYNQVCPEHMWLEDHTSGKTYDTFIDQDIRCIDQVGMPGQPFQPGCEASPFFASQIARVAIHGYTKWQFDSLP